MSIDPVGFAVFGFKGIILVFGLALCRIIQDCKVLGMWLRRADLPLMGCLLCCFCGEVEEYANPGSKSIAKNMLSSGSGLHFVIGLVMSFSRTFLVIVGSWLLRSPNRVMFLCCDNGNRSSSNASVGLLDV